jgi:hypothetical protein
MQPEAPRARPTKVNLSRRAPRPSSRHAATAALPLALIIALLGCAPASSRPAAAARPPAPAATGAGAAAPDAVWPYYAELSAVRSPAYSSPRDVTIRSTDTATVVTTVSPPRPYQTFGLVTGTGSPDRWVVGAQPWHPRGLDNSAQPVALFTLAFDPVSKRATLTRLPIPPVYADQLVSDPSAPAGPDQLAAVELSPDGTQVAAVTTMPSAFEVRVYTLASGTVRTWSWRVTAGGPAREWQFSLTWLDDSRTLAVGYRIAVVVRPVLAIVYLATTGPGANLTEAGRPVVLSFPAAKPPSSFKGPFPPDGCAGPPVVTSDGQLVLCSGLAATPMNAGGAQEVGVWGFSARTGKLTARWNEHLICCLVTTDEFPVILWASPRGRFLIASGMSTASWGEELFLRAPGGQLRRLPWQGIYAAPNTVPPIEPPVAW